MGARELHIGADIAFAVRQHWAATGDRRWLRHRGCPLVNSIAEFWASRMRFNESTRLYDLDDVMGPDEDHDRVANNAYTNLAVGLALFFAE